MPRRLLPTRASRAATAWPTPLASRFDSVETRVISHLIVSRVRRVIRNHDCEIRLLAGLFLSDPPKEFGKGLFG